MKSCCVLICAYNESAYIEEVVRSVLMQHPAKVIVVDDGSMDGTGGLAKAAGAEVIRHETNQGKGAALRTGFNAVLKSSCDAVVVVDGDGQHNPDEISRFIDAYERTGIPVLVGNRMANTEGMPFTRRLTNQFMSWVLNRLVKIYVADAPCGYRFYRTNVLPFIISDEERFAFEFDILVHAALRKIRIDSVRVSTIYNRKRRSHVEPLRDAVALFKVVKHHFLSGKRQAKIGIE